MKHGWRLQIVLAVGAVSACRGPEPAELDTAADTLQTACATRQVTAAVKSSLVADIDRQGAHVALVSDADLTGANPDGNKELVVFDVATGTFAQITNTTGLQGVTLAAINGDGTRLAFTSDRDHVGSNGDHNMEVFFHSTATGVVQVTNTLGGTFSFSPRISQSGNEIAFESTADLVGQNADGNKEIFLYAVDTNTFTQITSSPTGDSTQPSLEGAATRIAFASSADLVGDNPDGNFEISLWRPGLPLLQLTDSTAGLSFRPAIASDRQPPRVVFESTADLVGNNADGNQEVFMWDTFSGLTQITDSTSHANFAPMFNGDGSLIAFTAGNDYTGDNGEGNLELFVHHLESGTYEQVTEGGGVDSGILSANSVEHSRTLAFDSVADLLGANPDKSFEFFLASCGDADTSISQVANLGKSGALTYAIHVQNHGPSTAGQVVVRDVIPLGTTFLGAQSDGGCSSLPLVGGTGTVRCELPDLPPGASGQVTLSVKVSGRANTTITNTATVEAAGPDPDLSNNSASIQTSIGGGKKK